MSYCSLGFGARSSLLGHHIQGHANAFSMTSAAAQQGLACLLAMRGQLHAEGFWCGLRYLSGRKYACWGRSQINYILGSNGQSYAVGLGKQWPQYAAHPAASCSSSMQPCASLVSLLSPALPALLFSCHHLRHACAPSSSSKGPLPPVLKRSLTNLALGAVPDGCSGPCAHAEMSSAKGLTIFC